MRRVWVMQHAEPEGPGRIGQRLRARGLALRVARLDRDEPVPGDASNIDALVVMGGPMSVYESERYSFLDAERALIRDAIARERPVLGVCLGSQLLAATLGARVDPGPAKEIGFRTVTTTDAARTDPLFAAAPSTFVAFHWHGDVFDLPAGATALASSAQTAHQAFRFGARTYGLLFHLEVRAADVDAMIRAFEPELRAAGGTPEHVRADAARYLAEIERVGTSAFDAFAAMIG